MAKKITFKSEDQNIFDLIHGGFHASAIPGTKDQHRHSVRILDALDSISDDQGIVMFPGNPDSPNTRKLRADGGTCIFEDAEYGYLISILSGIKTSPRSSRRVLEMWALLDASEDGTIKDLTK